MKKLDVKSIKEVPFNDNIQQTASSQFKNSEKVYCDVPIYYENWNLG